MCGIRQAASGGTGECTLRTLSIILEQEPILHFKLKQSLGGNNGSGGAVSTLLEALEDYFQGNVFSRPVRSMLEATSCIRRQECIWRENEGALGK
jgi:hypothetical protein